MPMPVALIVTMLSMGVGAPTTTQTAQVEVRDPVEFGKILAPNAKLEKLATGLQFVEGPVWSHEEGGFLTFSDIPADQLKRWNRTDGLTTFRTPSHHSNGNTRDRQGRLITCEHGSRSVTLTEKDGTVRTLADHYNGKRLNSPNDVVVKSDGTIWFTDPPYGIDAKTQQEQPGNYVFRLDPRNNELTVVAADFDMPNGLCFSPDEKKLYIGDSGTPHHIRVFDVGAGGALSNGRIFSVIDNGVPDGIRCDREGRLYSSAGDGIQIFSREGKLIGKILVPETPANLCFGGPHGHTLFITARTSLYAIDLLSH